MHKRVTEFRRNMIDRTKLGQRPPTPFLEPPLYRMLRVNFCCREYAWTRRTLSRTTKFSSGRSLPKDIPPENVVYTYTILEADLSFFVSHVFSFFLLLFLPLFFYELFVCWIIDWWDVRHGKYFLRDSRYLEGFGGKVIRVMKFSIRGNRVKSVANVSVWW